MSATEKVKQNKLGINAYVSKEFMWSVKCGAKDSTYCTTSCSVGQSVHLIQILDPSEGGVFDFPFLWAPYWKPVVGDLQM